MIKLTPVKIGNTTVPHGLFLAPMAGFTDLEFRELCGEFGAEYTVTEMISAKAVCFGDKKTWELARMARMPGQANIGPGKHRGAWHGTTSSETEHDPTTYTARGNAPSPEYLIGQPVQANIGISSPETERLSHEDEATQTPDRPKVAPQNTFCHGQNVTEPLPSSLLPLPSAPRPCGVQIFGHDPDDIEQACRLLLDENNRPKVAPQNTFCHGQNVTEPLPSSLLPLPSAPRPCGVDLNMGCPVKKIVTSGDGSALMRDPALCERLTAAAVRGSGDVPVTVKIRAGFDADHKNAVEVALACVRGGASAVTVHGRTREQFYAPSSDNAVIAAVRDALPPTIPVIGNGDIATVEDAERMLRETGCDGIMIGRAALGDPWLFSRIIAAANGVTLPEPTIEERLEVALRLCRMVCERYGEARGVPMCRGRAGHFIRGISGAAAMRDRLCHATTLSEVESILTR